jgi:hypothetical protein
LRQAAECVSRVIEAVVVVGFVSVFVFVFVTLKEGGDLEGGTKCEWSMIEK